MPVPLAVAAPAATAALAYLNAKGSLWSDYNYFSSYVTATGRVAYRQHTGRLNFFYVLESQAQSRSYADKPLIIFEGQSHSYAAIYDRVLRYATWMKESLGVRSGDIVAMDFQNSDNFVCIWFALWALGARPAFINYNLTGAALAHCIKVASTALCIVDPAVTPKVTDSVRQQVSDVKFVIFTPDVQASATAAPPTRPPDEDRSQSDIAEMSILIYTSGTTGLPKPAIVSWLKCIAASSVGDTVVGLKPKDTMFSAMPLYHSTASVLCFLGVLQTGATQGLGRKFSTRTFWDDVRAADATAIQYVGETLRYLLAAPTQYDPITGESLDKRHRVRLAYGNGLRPDVWNRFKDRFGIDTIAEIYAATEGTNALINISSNDLTVGAVGRTGFFQGLMLSRAVAIVEVDWDLEQPRRDPATGFCIRVPRGIPGEVLFNLPADDPGRRFQGYYKNKDASSKKLLRDVFTKGDIYFRTGDVLRWDSEGRWFFHDRIGDTFRWKAENVSTTEVSEAMGTHPAVLEANVYGVQIPNHDGRAGCAAIHLDPKVGPSPDFMRSLVTHARAELPAYAVPLFLRVLGGSLGETNTGTNKQQKSEYRAAGVKPDPAKDSELGSLYWLANDSYVPFEEHEYRELEGGRLKL